MRHPGDAVDYPGYNVQYTMAATPQPSPTHPRITFTLRRPQPIDAAVSNGSMRSKKTDVAVSRLHTGMQLVTSAHHVQSTELLIHYPSPT